MIKRGQFLAHFAIFGVKDAPFLVNNGSNGQFQPKNVVKSQFLPILQFFGQRMHHFLVKTAHFDQKVGKGCTTFWSKWAVLGYFKSNVIKRPIFFSKIAPFWANSAKNCCKEQFGQILQI